ncbi:MAG: hypothetical protein LBH16_07745 [Treponema sp.]|jgi:hypothetical protein|nr:hypothetical protein [Treponema sp.]
MLKKAIIFIAAVCLTGGLSSCASAKKAADIKPEIIFNYIAPKTEDTPHFQILKASLEADGYAYTHYETGAGLVVWGAKNGESKGYGSKDEGIIRIPNDDVDKAYFISWDQYFAAFSQMHRACSEDEIIRDIKKTVDQLVLETDYDYSRVYGLPDGAKWVFHRDTKMMCLGDEYVNLVVDRVTGLRGVKEVAKVLSLNGEHSWNEILLQDGSIIYLDALWYDTSGFYLDSYGNYMVDHVPQYMPVMFTFDRDLFSIGDTHYNWRDAVSTAVSAASASTISAEPAPAFAALAEPASVPSAAVPEAAAPATAAPAETTPQAASRQRAAKPEKASRAKFENPFEFVGSFGFYANGWHENLASVGIPVQLGAEVNFGGMAFALLADGGAGVALPSLEEWRTPAIEWYYGGLVEYYIPGQRIGAGFSYGFCDTVKFEDRDSFEWDTFANSYMRFSLIHRNRAKQTVYGQLYKNGNWGFGILWTSGFTGRRK